MRKIIVYCDKCRCELDLDDAIKADADHDLCPDCARDILRHYFSGIKAPEPPKGVDWAKAQALRDAGWCPTEIAKEIGQSSEAVLKYTKNPRKKVRKVWEFSEYEDGRMEVPVGKGKPHEIL